MKVVHLQLQGGLPEGKDAQLYGQYNNAQYSHDLNSCLSFYSQMVGLPLSNHKFTPRG